MGSAPVGNTCRVRALVVCVLFNVNQAVDPVAIFVLPRFLGGCVVGEPSVDALMGFWVVYGFVL